MIDEQEDAEARERRAAEVARRLSEQLQAEAGVRLDLFDQVAPLDWRFQSCAGDRDAD